MYTLTDVHENIIIKRRNYADSIDSALLTETAFDPVQSYLTFRDAYYQKDGIMTYSLTYKDVAMVTDNPEAINSIVHDISTIYEYLNDAEVNKLLKIKRDQTLASYTEYNNYYRTLLGLPNMLYEFDTGFYIDTANFVYIDETIPGIDTTLPLHEMSYLERYTLKVTKRLNAIITENVKNPNREYLKYLDKDTNIITLRDGNYFDIIWSRGDSNDFNKFTEVYRQVKNHFVATSFDDRVLINEQFYEPLMCVTIIMFTLITITTDEPRKIIDSESIDDREIELTLRSYGVPLFNFSNRYMNNLVKRMNTLTMLKGTNKALQIVSNIFNGISLYKYFLIKLINDNITDYSDPSNIYKMVYIKTPIDVDDPYDYIETSEQIPYGTVAHNDPLWGYDQDIFEQEVLEMPFTYAESKYLGIDNSIDITMFSLKMSFWYRYVLERKDKFQSIKFYIDSLDMQVDLFHIMVYLNCILFRKMRLTPDIPDSLASVVFMNSIRNNIDYDRLIAMWEGHFRFSEHKDFIRNLRDAPYNSTYDIAIETWQVDMDIYFKLNELKKSVNTWEDFRMIDTILEGFTYGEKIPELFNNMTNYESYLNTISPNFFFRLEELDKADDRIDRLNSEMQEILNELIKYSNKARHEMYQEMLNSAISIYSDQDILDYIEQLINFYKSYTQDLLSKGLLYVLDDINEGIKITEQITFYMEMSEYDVITTALAFDNEELIQFLENLSENEMITVNERLYFIHPDTNEPLLINGSYILN